MSCIERSGRAYNDLLFAWPYIARKVAHLDKLDNLLPKHFEQLDIFRDPSELLHRSLLCFFFCLLTLTLTQFLSLYNSTLLSLIVPCQRRFLGCRVLHSRLLGRRTLGDGAPLIRVQLGTGSVGTVGAIRNVILS